MLKVKEIFYQDDAYQLAKAFDSAKDREVIVKLPTDIKEGDHAPFTNYRKELELQRKASGIGILTPIDVSQWENKPVLVLENFEGKPLSEWLRLEGYLPPRDFYTIAYPLVTALGELHAKHIIHKDLRPANILYDAGSGAVRLIGFALASQLSRETVALSAPKLISGSLPYISPEQTGRMNRQMDYRTDFYSLGVCFYQMLTGKLPFEHMDPLELIHSHLARVPFHPSEINSLIPRSLGDIILKMMNKIAEDRYQSASGLLADLHNAQNHLESFDLGKQDVSATFQIPQKLYGRDQDVNTLLGAFDCIQTEGLQVLFISGYSGIGKSSLVRETYKPITERKGYFISGKFDQLARNIPYAPIIQALEELVRQLLTFPNSEVQKWKERVLNVLGTNGKVIIDVIPDLELLIGTQPEVSPLPPRENRNRFTILFLNFIQVFATEDHPLVLFLDDLQWADSASLHLVQQLLTEGKDRQLMFIGAYRDNEVSSAHPLQLMLDELKRATVSIRPIHLEPLSAKDTHTLIADTLKQFNEATETLTEHTWRKTSGNPFFINEFLRFLYEKELLHYVEGQWQWDIVQIEQAHISDNIVELLVEKIQKLPPGTKEVLRLSSCFGNEFQTEHLSLFLAQSVEKTEDQLYPALQEGLLQTKNNGYRFAHDRIQQASYQLVVEQERSIIHLRIGRFMIAQDSEFQAKHIFDLANQLNLGRTQLSDAEEKIRIAQINLGAGRKAKASAAFETALLYFTTGLALLATDAWNTQYELMLALQVECAEALHLVGQNEEAEKGFDLALNKTVQPLPKADIYEKKIHFYTNVGRFNDAYQTAREAVALFGVKLPASITKPLLILSFIRTKIQLGSKTPQDLLQLPEAKNREISTAVRLISVVLKAAYQIAPPLAVANGIKIVQLTLKHGNVEDNAVGWLVFGPIFVGGIVGDRQTGYQLGLLALDLIEKYNNSKLRSEVNFVFGYFGNSWTKPAVEAEKYWQKTYHSGLETGDLFHVGCAVSATCMGQYMRGVSVPELLETTEKYARFVRSMANKDFYGALTGIESALLNLQGKTRSLTDWSHDHWNESDFRQALKVFTSRHFAHYYFINKAKNLFLFGHYTEALRYIAESDQYLEDSTGMLHSAEHHFWAGMIAEGLALKGLQPSVRKRTQSALKLLTKSAKRCPENFDTRLHLLKGMQALANKKYSEAETFLVQACSLAKAEDNLLLEALANQLLAQSLHAKPDQVLSAYQAAYQLYQSYGATAVADHLAEQVPALITHTVTPSKTDSAFINQPVEETRADDLLDLASVLKAAQAISGEIKLESLLNRLMEVVMENAGADKVALLLYEKEELQLMALRRLKGDQQEILSRAPLMSREDLPQSVILYVSRTGQFVLLNDALKEGNYINDPYIKSNNIHSVLCIRIQQKGAPIGILYLENSLSSETFTPARLELIQMLSSQIAVSVDNSLLYDNLERKVEERTEQLRKQKELIELINKDLTDSIQYAQRIQMALLPSLERVRTYFPKSFIFNRPKDIVSGDYYWVSEQENKVIIVVADCTGHGVPGAFMSVLGRSCLYEIVEQRGVRSPEKILTELHIRVTESLTMDDSTLNDGMDMAICAIDRQALTIEYAGANRPLMILADNQMSEILADKVPVGHASLDESQAGRQYTLHTIEGKVGMRLYMTSDGFYDQFGGERGRKMGKARFYETLVGFGSEEMVIQGQLVEDFFLNWKKDQRQIDDTLVIGIEL